MGVSANILMAGTALTSAHTQSEATRLQGRFAETQSEQNARLAELKAEETREAGRKAAGRARIRAQQVVGQQRAALAAQGQTGGTAEVLVRETQGLGEIDAIEIENNAWRQAWGLEVQALEDRFRGRIARSSSRAGANITLLTGGLQALAFGAAAHGKAQDRKDSKDKTKDNAIDFSILESFELPASNRVRDPFTIS